MFHDLFVELCFCCCRQCELQELATERATRGPPDRPHLFLLRQVLHYEQINEPNRSCLIDWHVRWLTNWLIDQWIWILSVFLVFLVFSCFFSNLSLCFIQSCCCYAGMPSMPACLPCKEEGVGHTRTKTQPCRLGLFVCCSGTGPKTLAFKHLLLYSTLTKRGGQVRVFRVSVRVSHHPPASARSNQSVLFCLFFFVLFTCLSKWS